MAKEIIQPYDDVIRRLKKELERKEEKVRKKPSDNNIKLRNEVRALLKQWEEARKKEASVKKS